MLDCDCWESAAAAGAAAFPAGSFAYLLGEADWGFPSGESGLVPPLALPPLSLPPPLPLLARSLSGMALSGSGASGPSCACVPAASREPPLLLPAARPMANSAVAAAEAKLGERAPALSPPCLLLAALRERRRLYLQRRLPRMLPALLARPASGPCHSPPSVLSPALLPAVADVSGCGRTA